VINWLKRKQKLLKLSTAKIFGTACAAWCFANLQYPDGWQKLHTLIRNDGTLHFNVTMVHNVFTWQKNYLSCKISSINLKKNWFMWHNRYRSQPFLTIETNRRVLHTLIDIVSREEALLSVCQFSHPPVVTVLEQHGNTVATFQRQFIRPLCLVVIQCNHL